MNKYFWTFLITATLMAFQSCIAPAYSQFNIGDIIVNQGKVYVKINDSTMANVINAITKTYPDKTVKFRVNSGMSVEPITLLGRWWIGQSGYLVPSKGAPELSDSVYAFYYTMFYDKLDFGNQLNLETPGTIITLIGGTADEITIKVEGILSEIKNRPADCEVYTENPKTFLYKVE